MIRLNRTITSLLMTLVVSNAALAGPYTGAKNNACPDSWSLTDKAIAVYYSSSSTYPWGKGADDKSRAKSHLTSARPVKTIDKLPIINDDLVNDPLTVASECLVYRNFEADTYNYVAPPAVTPNVATGWIPAVLY